MTRWLKFFLEGVRQTAENSIETFRAIIKLRDKIENDHMPVLGKRAKLGRRLLRYLYGKPIIDGKEASEQLSVEISTALRLINKFVELGILKETTFRRRNRIFVFEKYLKLFE